MESLRMPARLEHLEKLLSFVVQKAERIALPEEKVFSVKLAIEELLVNTISYGYPSQEGEVEVECFRANDGGLCVLLRDWGPPFNPLEREAPDLSVDLSERRIGGLGIYLVRQMSKESSYKRDGNANVLMLRF